MDKIIIPKNINRSEEFKICSRLYIKSRNIPYLISGIGGAVAINTLSLLSIKYKIITSTISVLSSMLVSELQIENSYTEELLKNFIIYKIDKHKLNKLKKNSVKKIKNNAKLNFIPKLKKLSKTA